MWLFTPRHHAYEDQASHNNGNHTTEQGKADELEQADVEVVNELLPLSANPRSQRRQPGGALLEGRGKLLQLARGVRELDCRRGVFGDVEGA